VTGPDPNSDLESEPDPVRVRHLANVGHKRPACPSSYKLKFQISLDFYRKFAYVKIQSNSSVLNLGQISEQLLRIYRGVNPFTKQNFYSKGKARKVEKRPGGGFLCTSTAWGRKTFKKNVSVTQSQPEPQTGRIQGTVVSLIRILGSHGPGVPKTREANVKCTDKTESKLDVRGHRHIRRQHILKATCFCNWVPKVA
ncbi:hypothetical protein Prudu_006183, partial [Prunus dulcis]